MPAAKKKESGTRGLERLFGRVLDRIRPFSDSSDILLIDKRELTLHHDDKNKSVSETAERGVKLRALDKGRRIETYTADVDEKGVLLAAEELSKALSRKTGAGKSRPLKVTKKSFSERGKKDPKKMSLRRKMDFLRRLVDGIMKKDKAVASARALYVEESGRRVFFDGRRFLSQDLMKVTLVMLAFVRTKEGETRFAYRSYVGNGLEILDGTKKRIDDLVAEAKSVEKARKVLPGKYTCILSPDISGLLAHESFGHGMESDTVYAGRAKSSDYIGKRIAPPHVSIADSPLIKGKHGSYFFDDEGNLSKETYLIKKGVVADYLTESFSANKLGSMVSSNSRCESFDHKNYARMSNTYFVRGDSSFEKMLSKVKDGMYLIKANGGGMEDPKGWGVQIQGIVAQRIRDGKLTDEFFDGISITGYLPDILSSIKDVSKEFEIEGGGNCGKGHKEWVPVATGGPYLLIDSLPLS